MILPVAAVVALVLCLQRRWRVAGAWALTVAGVLGALLVLKVGAYACGWLWPALSPERLAIRSPSGHTGSAAVVYGGVATMVAAGRTRLGPTGTAVLWALAIGVVIGATRIALGAHTPAEVGVALPIGVAGALAFALIAGRAAAERSGLLVLGAATAVILLVHGNRLPAESTIQKAGAALVREVVPACVPE